MLFQFFYVAISPQFAQILHQVFTAFIAFSMTVDTSIQDEGLEISSVKLF